MTENQVIFGMRALSAILSGGAILSWMLGNESVFLSILLLTGFGIYYIVEIIANPKKSVLSKKFTPRAIMVERISTWWFSFLILVYAYMLSLPFLGKNFGIWLSIVVISFALTLLAMIFALRKDRAEISVGYAEFLAEAVSEIGSLREMVMKQPPLE